MYLNEERHWWFMSKADVVKQLLNFFVADMENKKILDAGCGTSFLSKNISPNAGNIYNVDNCPISLEYSRKRGMINIINADLSALPFAGDMFDVGICMDVIEHNQDDHALVIELARVMKEGGVLVAAVPALPSLWGPQDAKLGHYRRYRKHEFKKLFEKDFDILKISYFNSLLFPMIFLLRKIFNIFPNILKERDEVDIGNKFLNNLLYKIFSMEAKLLKYINFPVGVSCLVVARRKAVDKKALLC